MDRQNPVITINVGGTLFATTRPVLERYKDSILYESVTNCDGHMLITDPNGNIFFDRDARLFPYILNFLRDGQLILPTKFNEFDLLLKEANFYKLEALHKEIMQLASYRKDIVTIKQCLHPNDSTITLVVTARKTTSLLLKDKFQNMLSHKFEDMQPGSDYYVAYYKVPARPFITTFLTEQGFYPQAGSIGIDTFVKDI